MKRVLLVTLLIAGLLPVASQAVEINAYVTLRPQGEASTAGRILFRHVLGGLHIEGYFTQVQNEPCQLLLFNGACSQKEILSKATVVLGDLQLGDENTGFYERIDPVLQARKLIGKHVAVVHKDRIIACGVVEAPPAGN